MIDPVVMPFLKLVFFSFARPMKNLSDGQPVQNATENETGRTGCEDANGTLVDPCRACPL